MLKSIRYQFGFVICTQALIIDGFFKPILAKCHLGVRVLVAKKVWAHDELCLYTLFVSYGRHTMGKKYVKSTY